LDQCQPASINDTKVWKNPLGMEFIWDHIKNFLCHQLMQLCDLTTRKINLANNTTQCERPHILEATMESHFGLNIRAKTCSEQSKCKDKSFWKNLSFYKLKIVKHFRVRYEVVFHNFHNWENYKCL